VRCGFGAAVYQLISKDEALAERFVAADEEARAQMFVELAREQGYDVPVEEVEALIAEGAQTTELSDAQLENVTGGGLLEPVIKRNDPISSQLSFGIQSYGSFGQDGLFIQTETFPR
jgi:predicted ribosomally synthesized peptide with nif11-like leader